MRRSLYAAVISVALLAACSDNDILAPVPAASKVASSVLLGFNADQPVRIAEFHYDNAGDIDVSEWIEISAPGGTNLQGYTIVLYRGSDGMSYGTRFLGSVVNASCSGRGVVLHMMPNNTLINETAGMALVRPNNTVVEFFSYEGSFTAVNGPAAGMTSVDLGVSEPGDGSNAPVTSLQRNGASPFWRGPIQNTFGSCNDQTEAPPAASVEVTPSSATLIVGATQQFTAVAYNASHQPIVNATISWLTSNASIATVSLSGLVTGVATGDVMIIASADGKADTAQVHVDPPPVASVEVTPASASILLGATQQFTAVAFDASHHPIATATISWSSSNSIATVSGSGLATGVAPGDVIITASAEGKTATAQLHVDPPPVASVEVTPSSASILVGATQQFTGVAFDASHQPIATATISWSSSNSSIAAVSASGLATGLAPGDVTIIATVDGKSATAQLHVEPVNHPPTALVNGLFTSLEASLVNMSGAASSDPDAGDVLTFTWNFGDGHSGTGMNVSHAYTQDGIYNVQLTVTDSDGLTSTVTTTATIGNVAPSIYAFAGATLLPGETYSATGSFADPGADTWTATVDYGNGSGVLTLPLSGKTFSLSRVYANPGVYTVTVRVSDDDATSTRTRTVTVLSHGQGLENALLMLDQLVADGKISAPNANPIREALEGVRAKLVDGKTDLAAQQLESALKHLDAAIAVGKISAANALPLRNEILRLLQSVSPNYVLSSTQAPNQAPKKKG